MSTSLSSARLRIAFAIAINEVCLGAAGEIPLGIGFAAACRLLICGIQQPMNDLVVLKGFPATLSLVVLSSQLLELNAQLLGRLIE